MSARPPKPDYAPEFEAVETDSRWRAGGQGRRCRRPHCNQSAVARLNRGRTSRRSWITTPSWWHYCAEHLYGHWIEDGKVMLWIPIWPDRTPGGATMGEQPMTLEQLQALLPDAHIEEVGDRRELVIYTGLSEGTDGYLVPMVDTDE